MRFCGRNTLLLLLLSFTASLYSQQNSPQDAPYSPSNRPRMAAEWESAVGVLVSWPLSIPKELLIELAKDTKVDLLVDGQKAKQDAIQWLTKWGVTPDRVRLITAPQGIDAPWTRDWGPHAVFSPEGDLKLADGIYNHGTPQSGTSCNDSLHFMRIENDSKIVSTAIDDKANQSIADALDMEMIKLPFVFTGGNVITDGQHSGFSTCIIKNENRYNKENEDKFLADVNQLTGIDDYHFISNFELNGIQHIDCFMKMLDEERLLVARPPKDHPLYDQYEGIVKQELSQLTNAYGRPYQILRIDVDRYEGDHLAAYTNALILNQTVYVPLFGIHQDSIAMEQWRNAMPGYTVKGFPFPLDPKKPQPYYRPYVYTQYSNIGWNGGDALHCRTRALWNPTMIYISVDRLPSVMPKSKTYPVKVILKDYSKGSLIPGDLFVMWRLKGDQEWKQTPLKATAYLDQFEADIPGNQAKVTIEYYVSAHSNWGTRATMPATAPNGFYSFTVN